jgi:hypothetical protein
MPDEPKPLLGWLAPYLEGAMDIFRGATGLGEQGPAGPTWTNAGALLAAIPPLKPLSVGGMKSLKALATGEEAAGQAAKGIKAYHGSPHEFEKFALEKIGTGEGAQAYGHGLYFAEREGVAKSYREALAEPTIEMFGKTHKVPSWRTDMDPQTRLLRRLGDNRVPRPDASEADIIALTRQQIDEGLSNPFVGDEGHAALRKELEILDQAAPSIRTKPGGKMYEVNIKADPEHFLDWDKPLNEQHPKVQQAVRDLVRDDYPTATGQQIYENVLPMHGIGRYEDKDLASAALHKAGIPGIKYLDQASRAAGEGTRNYVIFDDALIDILRKYGFLPPVVGGTLGLSQLARPSQQGQQ